MRGRIEKKAHEARQTWWSRAQMIRGQEYRNNRREGIKMYKKLRKPMRTIQFSSVQFSHSVMSNSLRPHESQHTRPPCPSPSPGVHLNSHPLSWWCHPAISSSVVPFSSCPQSLPASESFPMSQLFAWGGQSTAVSALASFPPKNTQDWSPLEWIGWISLQSKVIIAFHIQCCIY